VRVRTTSGSTYVLQQTDYTQSWDGNRDLVRAPPLQVKPVGRQAVRSAGQLQRVVILSSSILSIAVRYVPDDLRPFGGVGGKDPEGDTRG
jgi:hypothetical protein